MKTEIIDLIFNNNVIIKDRKKQVKSISFKEVEDLLMLLRDTIWKFPHNTQLYFNTIFDKKIRILYKYGKNVYEFDGIYKPGKTTTTLLIKKNNKKIYYSSYNRSNDFLYIDNFLTKKEDDENIFNIFSTKLMCLNVNYISTNKNYYNWHEAFLTLSEKIIDDIRYNSSLTIETISSQLLNNKAMLDCYREIIPKFFSSIVEISSDLRIIEYGYGQSIDIPISSHGHGYQWLHLHFPDIYKLITEGGVFIVDKSLVPLDDRNKSILFNDILNKDSITVIDVNPGMYDELPF